MYNTIMSFDPNTKLNVSIQYNICSHHADLRSPQRGKYMSTQKLKLSPSSGFEIVIHVKVITSIKFSVKSLY